MNKIGIIGLGKMGMNLIQNMHRNNLNPIGFDINKKSCDEIKTKGITISSSIDEMLTKLEKPRIIMIMVPSGQPTEELFNTLIGKMSKGDCIIDAGNSFYKDTLLRADKAKNKNIDFVDCGTSGGWSGALNGVCAMVGGDDKVIEKLNPIFEKLTIENGYLHTGKIGSGHYAKMIHNGIEYGMMQAIAEGYEILEKSQFNYDYEKISKLWNHGSVIRSWLIELVESAFKDDKKLQKYESTVGMNGEGLWTVKEAMELGVAVPVITSSVQFRQLSQNKNEFSSKLLQAMRFAFGGHTNTK